MRGILGDLSAGGCYVETIAPQPIGTSLELYLLTEGGEFEVGGLVRHAQPAMGMGVEFVNLKPDKLALINKLLQMMDKNEQSFGFSQISLVAARSASRNSSIQRRL